jgi:sugar/nucleoside kinase (ribokinase family)
MKILGIGESIIDKVHLVDSMKGGKNQPGIGETHVVGPVLSALIVLSRMGVACTLVTSLGRDEEAKIIKKVLKHEKIKLLHKIQKTTKVNTILVDKKTGKRTKLRGDTVHPDIKNLHRTFIRQFDLIIMDRHEKTAFYEVLALKKPSAKIIIDPSTEVSPFTLDMIKYADYPIIPIESLVKLCGGNIMTCLKKMYEIARKPLTITAGDLGSLIYDGKNIDHIPPYEIKKVDDLGAGDVYRGAFAYGITQNWSLKQSATFGNFVAALQCTKLGNVAAIPTKDAMQVFNAIKVNQKITLPKIQEYFATII